jgi:beta-ketodecanoyl-[acyl-carrier-protein] synthase
MRTAIQPTGVAITGTGIHHPPDVLGNEELCASFNEYVKRFNRDNADAIAAGEVEAKAESSPEFIVKASGIVKRYIVDKAGVLDVERMCPYIPDRPDAELSVQAEWSVAAARRALAEAQLAGEDIDMLVLASSNLQRMYPSIAMEVQHALGAQGFAYDVIVGCSSVTFTVQSICDAIRAGSATRALLVNPEVMSGHANWTDRDSHFIFGDAATAMVIEKVSDTKSDAAFEIIGTRLLSSFSNNIRNNGGFLNRCDPEGQFAPDKLFYQQGRRVFKDIVPLASKFIRDHVEDCGLSVESIDRYWLHQANLNMNQLIAKKLIGDEGSKPERAPTVLDTYGNTASCGSVLAFHHHKDDLAAGTHGVLCSFGAGYSIGSVVVRRA